MIVFYNGKDIRTHRHNHVKKTQKIVNSSHNGFFYPFLMKKHHKRSDIEEFFPKRLLYLSRMR